jgi:hypothetical protein
MLFCFRFSSPETQEKAANTLFSLSPEVFGYSPIIEIDLRFAILRALF